MHNSVEQQFLTPLYNLEYHQNIPFWSDVLFLRSDYVATTHPISFKIDISLLAMYINPYAKFCSVPVNVKGGVAEQICKHHIRPSFPVYMIFAFSAG